MNSKIQKNQLLKKISYAKLNLYLKIVSKRKDGFHNIFSQFYKIDLCDYLYFKPNEKLTVKCNIDLGLPENENIVYKAAVALNKFTNQKNTVEIEIEKNIPVGSGLGGGSSNAAITLLTLNELWELNLDFDDLLDIAAYLGSDVPFFLYEEPAAMVYGKGDILLPLNYSDIAFDCKNYYYLLVNPKINISTAKAYSLLDIKYDANLAGLENPDDSSAGEAFGYLLQKIYIEGALKGEDILYSNDFEDVICKLHPQLLELLEELLILSGDRAAMTGSGSSFFAFFKTKKQAKEAEEIIKSKFDMETFIGKLVK